MLRSRPHAPSASPPVLREVFLRPAFWVLFGLTASAAVTLYASEAAPITGIAIETAFQQPMAGASGAKLEAFLTGNQLFKTDWNEAAIAPQPFDGLGPLFSRSSCLACHPRNGRGYPPTTAEGLSSLVVRLQTGGGAAREHDRYGVQLDPRAVRGVEAEGRLEVSYEILRRRFMDGTAYELQRPIYSFSHLRFGAFGGDTLVSPRLPPGVYGLGLLEAVEEDEILAFADPEDRDRNGVSGRPNWVSSLDSAALALGRFGWKAEQPSLFLQVAGALSHDMGITSLLHPFSTCSAAETDCRQARSGGDPEISGELLNAMVTYMQILAPPQPRGQEKQVVRRGREMFHRARCDECHRPMLRTGKNPEHSELSGQIIYPYTDLLLHDMGPDLADGSPGHARSQEWRTPPLWGIGLSGRVNNNVAFLHDGRARNVLEAILWHGGEAESSRRIVESLPPSDRDALVSFLDSL